MWGGAMISQHLIIGHALLTAKSCAGFAALLLARAIHYPSGPTAFVAACGLALAGLCLLIASGRSRLL